MSREKQSFDIADKLNFEKQRRGEYARRIVEAVRYEGDDDHEDVHSILCDYRDEIIAGCRKQEWISVYDRLPEIMETVLIAYKEKWEWETEWNFGVDAGSWDIVEGRWNTYHDLCEGQELHITHWMPLPEAPKMKGGE